MRTPTKSETRGTTKAGNQISQPIANATYWKPNQTTSPYHVATQASSTATPVSSVAVQTSEVSDVKTSEVSDVNSKSQSFLTSAKNMFTNKCSEVKTLDPLNSFITFFCCAFVSAVILFVNIGRYQLSTEKTKQKNEFWIRASVVFQILFLILSALGIYLSYSTCNDTLGYVIGVMSCLIIWLSTTY